jgi:hypothetical protein
MDNFTGFGKMLIIFGAMLLGIGLFITFAGKILPLGRLPGDILVRKGNFTFYFPVITSIIVSIVLTILLNFFARK